MKDLIIAWVCVVILFGMFLYGMVWVAIGIYKSVIEERKWIRECFEKEEKRKRKMEKLAKNPYMTSTYQKELDWEKMRRQYGLRIY